VSSVVPFPVAPAVVTLIVAAKHIVCKPTNAHMYMNWRIRRCKRLSLSGEHRLI